PVTGSQNSVASGSWLVASENRTAETAVPHGPRCFATVESIRFSGYWLLFFFLRRKIRRGAAPLAGFLQLLDLALDQVALERAQMADEEATVKVIDLMLESAGEQVVARHFEGLAGYILRADGDALGASHVLSKVGQREAAFLSGLRTFA